MAPIFPFSIEPLGKQHRRAEFSSGNPALDLYLRNQARQDVEKKAAATFVLVERQTGAIAGFYSLSSTAVRLDQLPSETAKRLPRYPLIPATLLGRLAVHAGYRGKGLGEFLLLDALKRSLDHSQEIGSAAVIVDAKDDLARNFYVKHNFIEFPDQPMRLFLPMKTIAKLF